MLLQEIQQRLAVDCNPAAFFRVAGTSGTEYPEIEIPTCQGKWVFYHSITMASLIPDMSSISITAGRMP